MQFVVSGEELLQYAQLEGLDRVRSRSTRATTSACTPRPSSTTDVVLRAGDMAVLAPEDAHKPGCTLGAEPCHVRKIVVKVRS